MLLWRVMSYDELVRYKRGEIVRPHYANTIMRSKNNWKKAVVCFFGTANNAVHWASFFARHEVLVCFEIDQQDVESGWGQYPNLEAINKHRFDDILRLKVREYAVEAYSQRTAKLVKEIGISYKWITNNPAELTKMMGVEVLPTYDDIIK